MLLLLSSSMDGLSNANSTSQLGETPTGIQKAAVPEGRVAQAIGGGEDDDLQARLDSLRR